MRWFIPTWNGDLRLEAKDSDKTKLTIEKPTTAEKEALARMGERFLEEEWVEKWNKRWWRTKEVIINAPIDKVGPIAAELMRPGDAVLTAVNFQDGKVETSSGSQEELAALAEEAKKKDADAATVKRPTPCCPNCIPGAILPATEALLSFLTPEQHEHWSHSRSIQVEGGLSGHTYLLMHRFTEAARRFGKICVDLDLGRILHFHDWTVPPEEEVLAAKLILEHREPWLRNEATLFTVEPNAMIFKNPFGGTDDGVADSAATEMFGRMFRGVVEGYRR